jgi:rare lipoprotein A (peptidoglycan hydrolase)
LKAIRKRNAVLGSICILALASSASIAQAQSGGTFAPPSGGSVTSAPAPAASAGSWTVFKKATWYGPGLWGAQTACGVTLTPTTIGTAHRKLPCGTQVTFSNKGHSVTATVIDRGPFRKGYAWDLTKKAAKRIGFIAVGAGRIKATVTPAG